MSRQVKLVISAAVARSYKVVAMGVFAGVTPGTDGLTLEARREVLSLVGGAGWTGGWGQVGRVADPSSAGRVIAVYGLGPEAEFDYRRVCKWLRKVSHDAIKYPSPRVAEVLPDHY